LIDFINPIKEPKLTPKQAAFKLLEYVHSLNSYHHVFLDSNFFNLIDISLATERFKKIKITASVKKNCPSWLFADGIGSNLPSPYTRIAQSENTPSLVAASTHSNKIINLISNGFGVQDITEGQPDAKERRLMLETYDEHKGYTDQFDHLVSSYEITHRWKCDQMNLLMGWFQYALTNAYIIYINQIKDPETHKNFLIQVAKEFLETEYWNSNKITPPKRR
jgi:hypothetical protein